MNTWLLITAISFFNSPTEATYVNTFEAKTYFTQEACQLAEQATPNRDTRFNCIKLPITAFNSLDDFTSLVEATALYQLNKISAQSHTVQQSSKEHTYPNIRFTESKLYMSTEDF